MARRREYDPEQVIDRTIGLILRKGYFATSVDDLVRETGLNKHSLYAHYGNKRGLFLAALERYRDNVLGRIVAPLMQAGCGLDGITVTFENLAEWARGPEGRLGCLVCTAATDIAPHDREISERLNAIFDGLNFAFRRALTHPASEKQLIKGDRGNRGDSGNSRGDSGDSQSHNRTLVGATAQDPSVGATAQDPSVVSNYLVGVFQGFMALVKGPLPPRTADDYLKVSLQVIGARINGQRI